jgi:surface antigen
MSGMRIGVIAALIATTLGVNVERAAAQATGCPALGPKALTGALSGAAVGAGIGALAGKGKGAAIGGVVGLLGGAMVGAAVDQRDCMQAQAALRFMSTANVGQPIRWSDPATGNSGTITPLTAATPSQSGQVCRQYRRDSVISGQQTGGDVGVVCRTVSGDWQVVS